MVDEDHGLAGLVAQVDDNETARVHKRQILALKRGRASDSFDVEVRVLVAVRSKHQMVIDGPTVSADRKAEQFGKGLAVAAWRGTEIYSAVYDLRTVGIGRDPRRQATDY